MLRKSQIKTLLALACVLGASSSVFAASDLDSYALSGILQAEQVRSVLKGRMIEKISVHSEHDGRVSSHHISLTLSQAISKGTAIVNQTCLLQVTVEDIVNVEGTDRVVQASVPICK